MPQNSDATNDGTPPFTGEESQESSGVPNPNETFNIAPQDGTFDVVPVDRPQDGTFDVVPVDRPQDGTFDVVPVDRPQDGTFDVVPLDAASPIHANPPPDANTTQTVSPKLKRCKRRPKPNAGQEQQPVNWDRNTSTPNRPYNDQMQSYDNQASFIISGQGGVRPEERQAMPFDNTFNSPGANQTYVQSPAPNYQTTMSSGGWSEMDEYMQQNHPGEMSSYVQQREYFKSRPGALGGSVPNPNGPQNNVGPQPQTNPGFATPDRNSSVATSSFASGSGYYQPANSIDVENLGHGHGAQPRGFNAPLLPEHGQPGYQNYGPQGGGGPPPSSVHGLPSPSSPQNTSSSGYTPNSQYYSSPQSIYSQEASGVGLDSTFNKTSSSGSTRNPDVYRGSPGEQMDIRPIQPGSGNNSCGNPSSGAVPLDSLPPMAPVAGNQKSPYPYISSFNGMDAYPDPIIDKRLNKSDPGARMPLSPGSQNDTNGSFNSTGSTMSQDGSQPPTPEQRQLYMTSFNGRDARAYPNQRFNQTDPGIPMSNFQTGPNQSNASSVPESSVGTANMAFNATGSMISQDGSQPPTPEQRQLYMTSFNGRDAPRYPDERFNRSEGAAPLQFIPAEGNETMNLSSDGSSRNTTPTRPDTGYQQQQQNGPLQNGQTCQRSSPKANPPHRQPVGLWERDSSTPNRPYQDQNSYYDNDPSFMISGQGGLHRDERVPVMLGQTFNSTNPGAGQTYVQSPEPNYRTVSSAGWSEMDDYMKANHPRDFSHYEKNRDYIKTQPGIFGGRVPNPNVPPPSPADQTQGSAENSGSLNFTPNDSGARSFQGPNATFPLRPQAQGQQGLMSQSVPNPPQQGFNFTPNSHGAACNVSGASGLSFPTIDLSAELERLKNKYPGSPRDYVFNGRTPEALAELRAMNRGQNSSQPGYAVTYPSSSRGSTGSQDPNSSLKMVPYDGSSGGGGNRQGPHTSNMMAFNTASPDGAYQLKVVCMWNRK